jgi:hypothetical protein
MGIALLSGFVAQINSDFLSAKSEFISESEDSESPENENCELEKLQFFNYTSANFAPVKSLLHFTISHNFALQKYFLEVPTSPPNSLS